MNILLKADLWLIAQLAKVPRYFNRYRTRPGRHRTDGISTARWIEAQRT